MWVHRTGDCTQWDNDFDGWNGADSGRWICTVCGIGCGRKGRGKTQGENKAQVGSGAVGKRGFVVGPQGFGPNDEILINRFFSLLIFLVSHFCLTHGKCCTGILDQCRIKYEICRTV